MRGAVFKGEIASPTLRRNPWRLARFSAAVSLYKALGGRWGGQPA